MVEIESNIPTGGFDIMQTNQFEQAFSDFLDRREYDQAENALFSIVRIAFLAGWKAAGGEAPPPQKLFYLVHKDVKALQGIDSDLLSERAPEK